MRGKIKTQEAIECLNCKAVFEEKVGDGDRVRCPHCQREQVMVADELEGYFRAEAIHERDDRDRDSAGQEAGMRVEEGRGPVPDGGRE